MRRRWAVFICLLLLVSLPLAAAPRDESKPAPAERQADGGFFGALWSLLGDLVPSFNKARSSMDPDGGGTVPPGGSAVSPPSSAALGAAGADSAGGFRR
jgi:hypothetical protein